jgi:predicted dehydrogenase
VLLVLEHESGVVSSLAASAISGAPGPRARLLGDKGALVINELDPQENLLRTGNYVDGDKRSKVELHQGEKVTAIESIPGDYVAFYKEVAQFLKGNGKLPIDKPLALQVAEIIDQARNF